MIEAIKEVPKIKPHELYGYIESARKTNPGRDLFEHCRWAAQSPRFCGNSPETIFKIYTAFASNLREAKKLSSEFDPPEEN